MKTKSAYIITAMKPFGNLPLVMSRPSYIIITMHLPEIRCEAGKWMQLAQDHVQKHDAEQSASATTALDNFLRFVPVMVRIMIFVVRLGSGCNWLRITSKSTMLNSQLLLPLRFVSVMIRIVV
jgi:nitroreductase